MQINKAEYRLGTLILLTTDPEAARFVYKFKPGTYDLAPAIIKRSLNANAYAWALITQIGDAVRLSKEDVYLDMLKHYGQSEIVTVLSDIKVAGYFKYFEVAGTGTIGGKEFTHYTVYKGTSEYDTREMAIFIDGVVQECQNLSIETLSERELSLLKEAWHG